MGRKQKRSDRIEEHLGAIRTLVRRWVPRLPASSSWTEEDLVQDCVVSCLKLRSSFNPDKLAFVSWVTMVSADHLKNVVNQAWSKSPGGWRGNGRKIQRIKFGDEPEFDQNGLPAERRTLQYYGLAGNVSEHPAFSSTDDPSDEAMRCLEGLEFSSEVTELSRRLADFVLREPQALLDGMLRSPRMNVGRLASKLMGLTEVQFKCAREELDRKLVKTSTR